MKRFYLCLLLFCCLAEVSAQELTPFLPNTGDGRDEIEEQYINIYARMNRRLTQLDYATDRAGNALMARGQFNLRYDGPNGEQQFNQDFQQLKKQFGEKNVKLIGSCGCTDAFRIYNIFINPIWGEERGKAAKTEVAQSIGREEEEVTPNYYVIPGLEELDLGKAGAALPPNFTVVSSGKSTPARTIALLDSGIDTWYQDSANTGFRPPLYLWENPAPNASTDPFCYSDDLIGWDFINHDNYPLDDHSHGTHIASLIAQKLSIESPNLNYRFMPVKMLDEAGVGTTFTAACGVLYAAVNGAEVINASWGFYGERDDILYKTFKYAQRKGIVTVNSAGNFGVDIATTKHYPSEFALAAKPLKSILIVGASRSGWRQRLWPETNFRFDPGNVPFDFVVAPGTDVAGLYPHQFKLKDNIGYKTGTSVAAPYGTIAAIKYVDKYPNRNPVRARKDIFRKIARTGIRGRLNTGGNNIPYIYFHYLNF